MSVGRRLNWILLAGAGLLAVALCGANLLLGDLNQDEGWYLYAARLVSDGNLPYRDFLFSQGPLVPYVYALFRPLWDPLGLAGGRLVTALLGLAAAGLSSALAARLAPPRWAFPSAVTCFLLVSGNVYHSYFCTIVKTYSLTALFLSAGFLALSRSQTSRSAWPPALAGLLLACAAATRLSAGAVLPVAGLFLLTNARKLPNRWAWVVFGVTGLSALALLFVPWFVVARDRFIFDMTYHTARDSGGLGAQLVFKAGFVSRCVRGYSPAFALAGVAILTGAYIRMTRREIAAGADAAAAGMADGRFAGWLLGAALTVTVVHFVSPFPYDDYQVPLHPLFAAWTAGLVWRVFDRTPPARDATSAAGDEPLALASALVLGCVFLVSLVGAFSSPINQEWFVHGRDRLWWLTKTKPDLAMLRDAAARIERLDPGGRQLLTQDTYLAVETRRDVPAGLEMGPFTYYPDLSAEDARRLGVLNRDMLTNLLAGAAAPVAAVSGYGLAVKSPQVTKLPEEERESLLRVLRTRYDLAAEIPYFGQGHTTLTLWKRKPSAGNP